MFKLRVRTYRYDLNTLTALLSVSQITDKAFVHVYVHAFDISFLVAVTIDSGFQNALKMNLYNYKCLKNIASLFQL